MKTAGQEAAIGKALWHQVTTVVILRENMRQKTQTDEDALLRTALVNMRYGRCTPEDVQFLRTRIAGKRPGQPDVAAKEELFTLRQGILSDPIRFHLDLSTFFFF